MADPTPRRREPSPGARRDPKRRAGDAGRALELATARMTDGSRRLAGEDSDHATVADAAHWIAVYTELLSFKTELLAITGMRRISMSADARGEAADDHLLLGAQADRYARRLEEWTGHARTVDADGHRSSR